MLTFTEKLQLKLMFKGLIERTLIMLVILILIGLVNFTIDFVKERDKGPTKIHGGIYYGK